MVIVNVPIQTSTYARQDCSLALRAFRNRKGIYFADFGVMRAPHSMRFNRYGSKGIIVFVGFLYDLRAVHKNVGPSASRGRISGIDL